MIALRKSEFDRFRPIFMTSTLVGANERLRSRLTLREEGQVAGLESPNGLGAIARISSPGNNVKEISRIFCGPGNN